MRCALLLLAVLACGARLGGTAPADRPPQHLQQQPGAAAPASGLLSAQEGASCKPAVTAFVLRSVSPPSWTCMHGETATFWPTIAVRKAADCSYKISARDGVVAPYATTTAKVAYVNDQGAWVPWRDFSYDVSFSVGSEDGYCGANSHGKPYPCPPNWASFQRLLAFGLPAFDYSKQIYGVDNVKTDKLTVAPTGRTGFTVTSGSTKCTFTYEAVTGFWAGLGAQACKPGSRPICLKPGQKCAAGSCPAEVKPVAGGAGPATSFCRLTPPGTYSADGKHCLPCPPGTVAFGVGSAACVRCPPSMHAAPGATGCLPGVGKPAVCPLNSMHNWDASACYSASSSRLCKVTGGKQCAPDKPGAAHVGAAVLKLVKADLSAPGCKGGVSLLAQCLLGGTRTLLAYNMTSVDPSQPDLGLAASPQWQLFPQFRCTMAGCCGLNYSPTSSMCVGTSASSPTLGLSNPALSSVMSAPAIMLQTTLDKGPHAPDAFVSAGDAYAWSVLMMRDTRPGMIKAHFFRNNRYDTCAATWLSSFNVPPDVCTLYLQMEAGSALGTTSGRFLCPAGTSRVVHANGWVSCYPRFLAGEGAAGASTPGAAQPLAFAQLPDRVAELAALRTLHRSARQG